MTLRLPLTLAVLDVMLVKVAGVALCHPAVLDRRDDPVLRAPISGACRRAARCCRCAANMCRSSTSPRASRWPPTRSQDNRFVVLCEAEGGVKVALVVDDIIGQQQVVIKRLEENFESIEGIAGGTILGDGNVALIVDVQGLKSHDRVTRTPPRTATDRTRDIEWKRSDIKDDLRQRRRSRGAEHAAAHRLLDRRADLWRRDHHGARNPRLERRDAAAQHARISCAA